MFPPSELRVPSASLADYDGSPGFLVDSNVWIDCIDAASPWHEWAVDQLQVCSERALSHSMAVKPG